MNEREVAPSLVRDGELIGYVCFWCKHESPVGTPGEEILEHSATCEAHPQSKLLAAAEARAERWRAAAEALRQSGNYLSGHHGGHGCCAKQLCPGGEQDAAWRNATRIADQALAAEPKKEPSDAD